MPVEIGEYKLEEQVVVAPMAGVTDYPFRQILRKMGAQLLYTEMVSAKGLVYGSKRTKELIDFSKTGYTGVQLFGSDPEIMVKAAQIVERDFTPDLIDINLGCPAPKIVKNGSGSALMKKPELTFEIIRSVVEAIDLPVTVKMRKGWNQDLINAVRIASLAEKAGAVAISVHGRTRDEYYSGEADWDIITQVKKEVNIPVFGNGDVFSPEDARAMMDTTGCDVVMVARGIQGNPWLYERATKFLKTGELLPEPDFVEKIDMALNHLRLAVDYFGEEVAVPRLRKHISWYIKGMPYANRVKDKVNKLKKETEIKKVLNQYKTQYL